MRSTFPLGGTLASAGLLDSERGANLAGADLGSADWYEVDAQAVCLRQARLDGAAFFGVCLRGADLAGASVQQTTLMAVLDDTTVVTGLSGSLYGPARLAERGAVRDLAGLELELWLNNRGATVQVLNAPPGATTYYALVDDQFPRSHPAGIVRRRRAGSVTRDEAFTRNLRWDPTEYLRCYELGHNDEDHVEISETEADRIISGLTQGHP